MDSRLNNISLLYGGFGIILQVMGLPIAMIAGMAMGPPIDEYAVFAGVGVIAFGLVMLAVGMCYYAMGKGRSAWWGLVGLLGIPGLIVLGLLPDLHARANKLRTMPERIEDLPIEGGVEFRCLGCQYMLNAVKGNACPECGRTFNPDNLASVAVVGIEPPTAPWQCRWSLICGIAGFMMFCLPCISQLGSILGIVFGHVAMSRVKQMPQENGRGLAIAGLIVSYLSLGVSVLYFFLVFANNL